MIDTHGKKITPWENTKMVSLVVWWFVSVQDNNKCGCRVRTCDSVIVYCVLSDSYLLSHEIPPVTIYFFCLFVCLIGGGDYGCGGGESFLFFFFL